jgi:hypothetical protein
MVNKILMRFFLQHYIVNKVKKPGAEREAMSPPPVSFAGARSFDWQLT